MAAHPFSPSSKRAFVIGGMRGIGAAIATALADAGGHVIVGGGFDDGIRHATERIRAGGHDAEGYLIDVTDERSVARAASMFATESHPVGVLVNAAGISPVFKRAETLETHE